MIFAIFMPPLRTQWLNFNTECTKERTQSTLSLYGSKYYRLIFSKIITCLLRLYHGAFL
jgi:hypothetical protein